MPPGSIRYMHRDLSNLSLRMLCRRNLAIGSAFVIYFGLGNHLMDLNALLLWGQSGGSWLPTLSQSTQGTQGKTSNFLLEIFIFLFLWILST